MRQSYAASTRVCYMAVGRPALRVLFTRLPNAWRRALSWRSAALSKIPSGDMGSSRRKLFAEDTVMGNA